MTRLADQLQRFHALVTGNAALDEATGLVQGDRITAADRMHVYAHAYLARIAGVLAADYPKLDATLGSVRPLVAPYLRAHPPSDVSLREVGRHLAHYLAERGDAAHLVDLARLERARIEAFDGGADVAPLRRDDVAALGLEAFPTLALQLVPSSHVVELATNADELWDALESARPPPVVLASPRTVLVWRRDVTVIHRTLAPDEAPLVRLLAAGTTFGHICDQLVDAPDATERALALLLRWLDGGILGPARP